MTRVSPGELNLIMQGTNPMCAHTWWNILYPSFIHAGWEWFGESKALHWHILGAKYVLGPGDMVLVPSGLVVYDIARSN